jgi:hypothetical protein
MLTSRKITIGISLALLFMIPTIINYTSIAASGLSIQEGQDGITITTNFMTMKIVEDKPHFIWWNGNQSTADEIYNVQITKIEEFFGNDDVLDNQTELDGVTYNLLTTNWATDIVEEANFVTVTLTSIGLANGAELQFIIHAYSEDQPIEGTDKFVEALTEVKFDIIVNNWQFSETAQGLAIKTQTLESQERHRIQIRNGSAAENGNATRSMQFESEEHGNTKVAYFEWATFAEVYDGAILEDTLEVDNVFLFDGAPGPGPGLQSMIEMYLTYPNYGNNLKLVHDPSIGIYPEAFSIPLPILPILGGLIVIATIVIVIKKRK